MKRSVLFLVGLSCTLTFMTLCSCGGGSSIKDMIDKNKSNDVEAEAENLSDDDLNNEQKTQIMPITRDVEFMIFLRHFTSDENFQFGHIKFPLGKLSYAHMDNSDKKDSFTKKYWMMQDINSLAGYFTWKNDNKIVYLQTASMTNSEADYRFTYTFEKINGVWYVTQGDYEYSDVGIAEYTAEMASESLAAFRNKHRGTYTPYEYNGTPGKYPEASDRLLKEKDVAGLSKEELRLMRNEIMARHGYVFKSDDLRSHFMAEPWYFPLMKNVGNSLTDIENENVKFIQAHEK